MRTSVFVRVVVVGLVVAALVPSAAAKQRRQIETGFDPGATTFRTEFGPCPGGPPAPGEPFCDTYYLTGVSGMITAKRSRCLAGRQVDVTYLRNGQTASFGTGTTDETGAFVVGRQQRDIHLPGATLTLTVVERKARRATCLSAQTTVRWTGGNKPG